MKYKCRPSMADGRSTARRRALTRRRVAASSGFSSTTPMFFHLLPTTPFQGLLFVDMLIDRFAPTVLLTLIFASLILRYGLKQTWAKEKQEIRSPTRTKTKEATATIRAQNDEVIVLGRVALASRPSPVAYWTTPPDNHCHARTAPQLVPLRAGVLQFSMSD